MREVVNPKLFPEELIRIADYYSSNASVPFALRLFVRDPFCPEWPHPEWYVRRHRMGEYIAEDKAINIFLANAVAFTEVVRRAPVPMGLWLAGLQILLHEIGHHQQGRDLKRLDNGDEVGYYWSWPEQDARRFALREIHRLATLDDDLFMPRMMHELGWLGVVASRCTKQLMRDAYERNSWQATHALRSIRMRAIHIPLTPKKHWLSGTASVATLDSVAEQQGLVWQDRRGRRHRYLRLGQAVRHRLFDKALGWETDNYVTLSEARTDSLAESLPDEFPF